MPARLSRIGAMLNKLVWTADQLGFEIQPNSGCVYRSDRSALPMAKIKQGVSNRGGNLRKKSTRIPLVQAIMTTDTFQRSAGAQFKIQGRTITMGLCQGRRDDSPNGHDVRLLINRCGWPAPVLRKILNRL